MRPKDEMGRILAPPHQRLENAVALEQAAIFALAKDGRACALPLARKITLVRKAIDHVVDGDVVPKWIDKKVPDGDDRVLPQFWSIAVKAVREGLAA